MAKKSPPSTIEIGTTGLNHNRGVINEERNPHLRGARAAAAYEEMADNDPIVGAILYAIEAFLRSVDWEVEPAGEEGQPVDPVAQKWADFLETCMEDMEQTWEEFISEALSFLVYGHSAHETVYKIRKGVNQSNSRFYSKYDDGLIGWRGFPIRAQSTIARWDLDEESGKLKGLWQSPPNLSKEIYIPAERFVLFRTKSVKNSPEGRSILRNAYRSWRAKKRLEEIEGIGISRDLVGIPVVEVPVQIMATNATADQTSTRAELQDLVSSIHRDEREGIVFPAELDADGKPTGYKLRLLASPGLKQVPADPVIRRYDSRIAMALLADFIMLGSEKQGSYALAAEKSSNFIKSLKWYVDALAGAINTQAVARLMQANNVPPEYWPEVCAGDIDSPDLKDLGMFLQQVALGKLLTPTAETEAAIREAANLPVPDDLDEMHTKMREREDAKADAELAATEAKAEVLLNPPQPPAPAGNGAGPDNQAIQAKAPPPPKRAPRGVQKRKK